MSDNHGPFDPDELVLWAERYGHPEEWAKKAQQAHARAERLAESRDRYYDCLVDLSCGWVGDIRAKARRALYPNER